MRENEEGVMMEREEMKGVLDGRKREVEEDEKELKEGMDSVKELNLEE